MEPSTIKPELLVQSLNYHGQQLQKVWEAERGETDLPKLNVDIKALDFGVYQQRQKNLSFQDRGKRLKLQQFIVKKASALFDTTMMEGMSESQEKSPSDDDYYAVMPPFETFLDLDKPSRTRHFFEIVKVGDIVICSIQSKSVSGMMLKILCTDGETACFVADLNVKALCPVSSIIPAVDKNAVPRNYMINDTVCCEVLEVIADTDKLVVGMKGVTLDSNSAFANRLGLIHSDDFPPIYKKAQEFRAESYEKHMERSLGFSNPNNITFLSNALGLGQTHYSNMPGMRGRFSEQEYATELRHMQASKWAFKSVAEGIEHFKSGRHTEAFGCLNKALHIDPRNVEGLVARGALYANSGSFVKAIEDFENALKLNQNHQNARKYMGETLVALGRSYEDENKFEEALKSYENCLAIIPFHEEAQNSIEFLKAKIGKLGDVDSVLPGMSATKTLDVKESLKHLLKSEEEDNTKKDKDKDRSRSKKKKDRKSRKRRRRSSTSSSSSSSGSSHSSSSSSSSSSDSSSGSSHSGSNSPSPSRSRKSKKHKKRGGKKEDKKDKSLSPLSKRMALMDPGRGDSGEGLTGLLAQRLSHYNPPALPFAFTRSAATYPDPDGKASEKDDYEQKVCRFLEQTKGDSEYEEKVRKFLEETARWKKERKAMEEKGGGGGGKKKKRKEKKSKEKGKKKRDHDKKKRHRSKKGDFEDQMDSKKFRDALRKELGVKDDVRKRKGMDDDEEFLYGHGAGDKKDFRLLGLDNLPDLEDLETKLSAYYAKVEKGTGLSKGRNEDRPEKRRHMSPKVVYVHDGNEKEMMHMREKKSSSMDIFADSHSQESKNKFSASEAANLMNSKWKMQIGSVGGKIKKRERSKFDQEPWEDADDKRFDSMREESAGMDSDEELQKKRKKQLDEKVQARKAAMLEAAEKRSLEKQKKEEKREEAANKAAPFMGKFPPGFRSISSKVLDKKDDLPPLPPGMPPKIQFPLRGKSSATVDIAKGLRGDDDDDTDKRKKRGDEDKKKPGQGGKESGGSSHSRSRSRGKYSRASSTSRSRKSGSFERRRTRSGSFVRSRSRSYGRYRSSGSRSRSRSYRSRSRSYNSRSRSRSEDGHYRRRSRSQSDDRRRRDYHMNKYQGRYPRNRGTYYRPRFQNYKNPRGNFVPRGGRNFHPKFMHNNRGRPFIHRGRGRGGGGQGRFFHYKRGQGYNKDYQHRDRRYDRPRSRDSDDRRSYSRDREEEDPMKKVDAAKEKINKYLAEEEKKDNPVPKRSKDDPLSEGEERDEEDYPPLPSGSAPGFVDRKVYEEKA